MAATLSQTLKTNVVYNFAKFELIHIADVCRHFYFDRRSSVYSEQPRRQLRESSPVATTPKFVDVQLTAEEEEYSIWNHC